MTEEAPDRAHSRSVAEDPATHTVLGKAVAVLNAFSLDDHALPLAEIVRRTGLAKGTAHRIAADLIKARLLDRDHSGYRLGNHLFQLGMRASVERSLIEVATPFLEELYEQTHETVHLAVRDGQEVVYVLKLGGHRQAASPSRVGGRMPMHCTAVGKVLLADAPKQVFSELTDRGLARRTPHTIVAAGILANQLRRVRHDGLAYEHEESQAGLACVAAPVVGTDGRVLAAVSVTGPTTRFRPEQVRGQVRAAGAGITTTLARRTAHNE